MPSEDTTSTLGVVLSHSKIDLSLFGQYVGSDMVISKKCNGNWLYVLKCEKCKTFSEFEKSVNALDENLRSRSPGKSSSYFIPVMGKESQTSDIILIGALGTPLLEEVFDENTGKVKEPAEVWQMSNTVPPRKRMKPDDNDDTPLLPGIMKLSKQLHVDFSVNIYGDEGKRKRVPVSSIYREEITTKEQRKKKNGFTSNKSKEKKTQESVKPCPHHHQHRETHSEFIPKDVPTDAIMTMMLESISTAHAEALSAKKEIIKVMAESHKIAINAKENIIKTQAALIEELAVKQQQVTQAGTSAEKSNSSK